MVSNKLLNSIDQLVATFHEDQDDRKYGTEGYALSIEITPERFSVHVCLADAIQWVEQIQGDGVSKVKCDYTIYADGEVVAHFRSAYGFMNLNARQPQETTLQINTVVRKPELIKYIIEQGMCNPLEVPVLHTWSVGDLWRRVLDTIGVPEEVI